MYLCSDINLSCIEKTELIRELYGEEKSKSAT